MISYILLGLIFTSIFTLKSIFFNYAFSSSLSFIYPFEILALISYNSRFVGINDCIDCMNIFIEWLLLGWLGLPLENDAVKIMIPDDEFILDNMKIVILISWLISFMVTIIIKAIHYRCRFGRVYISNIFKVILKFFMTNYTSLLLWAFVSFIKKNSFYVVKFWFELFNLGLFLFLLFGIKSIIMYIMYGNKRVFYRSIYMFIHSKFKKNKKLWLIFTLLFKDILIVPTSLMIIDSNIRLNSIIVNYLLVGIMLVYSIICFKINPYIYIADRKDYVYTNIMNVMSLIYIIMNELSLYLDSNSVFILWVIKSVILLLMIIIVIIMCYKNYIVEKRKNRNKKDDTLISIEIPKNHMQYKETRPRLPTSIDLDV